MFAFIYLAGVLGERVRYDLRKKTFNHLQDLSLTYYSKTPVGWIMSRVTSDTVRIAELVTWGMLDVTAGVVSIVTAFAFMLSINWQLALLVLLIIPVLLFVAAYFKQKIIVEFRQGAQDQQQDHGRVQREHHRRARGQGAGPRRRKPARVRRVDGRDVSRRVSARRGCRRCSCRPCK